MAASYLILTSSSMVVLKLTSSSYSAYPQSATRSRGAHCAAIAFVNAKVVAVNFAFSEEQEELRKSVRRFLEDKSPESEVRRLMETTEGYDPAVWNQMAQQLGLQGLAIPEDLGGSGYTYVELIIIFEEMGRSLL